MALTDSQRAQRKKARSIYAQGLRNGKVVRVRFCHRCGSTSLIQGHHDDYDKPLEIISLCSSCHTLRHDLSEALQNVITNQAWLHQIAYKVATRINGKSDRDAESFARSHVAKQKTRVTEAWENFIIRAVKDA